MLDAAPNQANGPNDCDCQRLDALLVDDDNDISGASAPEMRLGALGMFMLSRGLRDLMQRGVRSMENTSWSIDKHKRHLLTSG
jgi:hypothetical protein